MRRLLLAASLALLIAPAAAQSPLPGGPTNQSSLAITAPTPPNGDNSNRVATTKFVLSNGGGVPGGVSGDIQINSAGVFGGFTPGAGCVTFLTTPSSANLRGCLTDESGTGLAYFQGGDIGTPSAGVATNLTGTAAGLNIGGNAATATTATTATTANAVAVGNITGAGAGCITWLTTPSSANLRGCLTDESGTGVAYFQGGDLGTPSAGVLTNASGTAASLTAGNATKLATARAIGIAGSTGLTATGVNFDGTAAINPALTGTLAVANGGTGDTGTAWASYSPTAGCGSGSLTTASQAGRFKQIGKTVFFSAMLTITTNGTCATFNTLSLPVTAVTNAGAIQVVVGEDSTGISLNCSVGSASTVANIFKYDSTYPGATGKTLYISGTYEAN